MIIMSRATDKLRWHIARMMFNAWKKLKTEEKRNEQSMARLIRIKEMQARARMKDLVFRAWRNLSELNHDDRQLRLYVAIERCIVTLWWHYITTYYYT